MNKLLSDKDIANELTIDAKAIGIPAGAAESFINRTIKSVEKKLGNKKIITENDLERLVAKELEKYNPDLAYVYKNRDTII